MFNPNHIGTEGDGAESYHVEPHGERTEVKEGNAVRCAAVVALEHSVSELNGQVWATLSRGMLGYDIHSVCMNRYVNTPCISC